MSKTTLQALLLSLDSATRIYEDAVAAFTRTGDDIDYELAMAHRRTQRKIALSVSNAVPG
jgi:hypothetical protein